MDDVEHQDLSGLRAHAPAGPYALTEFMTAGYQTASASGLLRLQTHRLLALQTTFIPCVQSVCILAITHADEDDSGDCLCITGQDV